MVLPLLVKISAVHEWKWLYMYKSPEPCDSTAIIYHSVSLDLSTTRIFVTYGFIWVSRRTLNCLLFICKSSNSNCSKQQNGRWKKTSSAEAMVEQSSLRTSRVWHKPLNTAKANRFACGMNIHVFITAADIPPPPLKFSTNKRLTFPLLPWSHFGFIWVVLWVHEHRINPFTLLTLVHPYTLCIPVGSLFVTLATSQWWLPTSLPI